MKDLKPDSKVDLESILSMVRPICEDVFLKTKMKSQRVKQFNINKE